ncbi:G-protein coupled receptor Mth2-like isoform X1 [Stomoxys calcitrans]|uniref:G-protein coupled receptor Mth2-like isoform X1 n=1 Tax=Stomoxys calcitrans TaxID=35570 RepID=UPI0027E30928|nr:G-protein coupled receptor Mth2-like isoform X1 [Stomoxys calcitrans]
MLATYNYRLKFQNSVHATDLHVRGCVCSQRRYCVKLCCKNNHFFNETSLQCQKLPEDFQMPTEIEISMDNGTQDMVKIVQHFIPQVGQPCEMLESLSLKTDKWQLNEDGQLHILNDNSILDVVSYCLTPYKAEGANESVFMAMTCPIPNDTSFRLKLKSIGMLLSLIFLIPTLLVYLISPKLRRRPTTVIFVCYSISLIGCYSLFCFINISEWTFELSPCRALGFSLYFLFVSTYTWLNVMGFDTYASLTQVVLVRQNRKRIIWYCLYGWGVPSLLTLITMWCQDSELIADLYKPDIGEDVCWLNTEKWAAAMYFYGPNSILMSLNVAAFIQVYWYIRKNGQTLKENCATTSNSNALAVFRLFILMGISWIMDSVSFFLRHVSIAEPLFIMTDFYKSIQGLLIFIFFVLKKSTLKYLWNSIVKVVNHCKPTPRKKYLQDPQKPKEIHTMIWDEDMPLQYPVSHKG